MKVLILEDEHGAARNLSDILLELEPDIEILAIIESVGEAVLWIQNNPKPQLGFFDIRLADGESFEIFEKVKINFPVIFTTAYEEYALRAFKVNSIDYLLKPISKESMEFALDKYKSIYTRDEPVDNENLLKIIQELKFNNPVKYKKSLLVYIGDQILPVAVQDIAYFHLENELVYCITHKNDSYIIDQPLDRISGQMDPEAFFRANRQFIVSRKAVNKVAQHFHRKLKLIVSPAPKEDILVGKTKATLFKEWLTN